MGCRVLLNQDGVTRRGPPSILGASFWVAVSRRGSPLGVLRALGVLLLRHGGQNRHFCRSSEAQYGIGEPFNGMRNSIGDRPTPLHHDLVVRHSCYGTSGRSPSHRTRRMRPSTDTVWGRMFTLAPSSALVKGRGDALEHVCRTVPGSK